MRGGERTTVESRLSIDEEELLKLLNENSNPSRDMDNSDAEEMDLNDEERADSKEENSVDQASDNEVEEEESKLSPVTPEEDKDIPRMQESGSSGKAKDSPTDGSSVEEDISKKKKRKADQESKFNFKKPKYVETDNTVRRQGWAEKLLRSQQTVVIRQVHSVAPPQDQPIYKKQASATAATQSRVVRRGMELPPGWLDCPGLEGKWGAFFVFSKTPLGERWNHLVPRDKRYTPEIVLKQAAKNNQHIGLVIDLTNSSLYYEPREFESHNVRYHKIRCCGRGETPSPESVNEFWWVASDFSWSNPGRFILVHCTHGFNRTGFMLAHFIMRWAESDTMDGIIRSFARRRPPGIYKDEYINELLQYYHEPRCPDLITPPVPEWKGIEHEEREDGQAASHITRRSTAMVSRVKISADDEIGEKIHPREQKFLQERILNLMSGGRIRKPRFPGAQPVSMDRNNLELLSNKRYWVTYKADGTRYMLLVMRHGVFVINREFEFQRVEQRFPFKLKDHTDGGNPFIGHDMTLFDGEMVIDHDKEKDTYTRKYLMYDLVLLQGQSLMSSPWKQRFSQLQEIVKIRNYEKSQIAQGRRSYNYRYSDEPFGVEAKMFWCLGQVEGAVSKTIPSLLHECDGFIFQGYEDKYQIGTQKELLKWKYPHMNSVDFRYRQKEDALYLIQGKEVLCEGAKVLFKDQGDKFKYDGKIIECSYDKMNDCWLFMRERVDKSLPNALSVYEKVLKSIKDNITQEELIERMLHLFAESDVYQKDREKLAA